MAPNHRESVPLGMLAPSHQASGTPAHRNTDRPYNKLQHKRQRSSMRVIAKLTWEGQTCRPALTALD